MRLIRYFQKWAKDARENHGVNPWIFGILYFGTIPPYGWSLWGVIKNYKDNNIPAMLWWMAAVLVLFLCPYLYLIVWGRNLSKRFYLILATLILIMAIMAAIKLMSAMH